MAIIAELKRRKVVQVATAYAVVSWILVQIVTQIEEPLALPAWVDTFVIVCLGIGFPIALILSWAFDVTPEGIKATEKLESGAAAPTAPTLALVLQVLVLIAVSFLLLDRYLFNEQGTVRQVASVGGDAVTRFSIPYPANDLEFQAMRGRIVALSRDGRNLLIGRPEGLMVRPMDDLKERVVVDTGRANSLTVSPDGQSVAYWEDATQQVRRVAIRGSAPTVIGGSSSRSLYGAAWESDETFWFSARGGIYRAAVSGGREPELVIPVEGDLLALGPTLLPDGDSVLFNIARLGEWDNGEIVVESLSTNERKVLLSGGSNARYLPTGHLLYALGSRVYARQFDLEALSVTGEAIPLIDDVIRADMVWQTGVAQFDVSLNGTLVYVSSKRNRSRTLVWVDRDGRETMTGMEPGDYDLNALSSQRTHVLLRQARPENTIKVWDLENSSMTHLAVGPRGADSPAWMPDGENIAYHPGTGAIIDIRTSNNAGNPRRIVTGKPGALDPFHPMQALSTGAELIIEGRATPSTRLDIGKVTVDGDGEVDWLIQGPGSDTNPRVSPDGQWIAYQSDESGQNEIFVRPFPNVDDNRWKISNRGGTRPVWGPEGDALYYIESGQADRMMAVDVDPSQPDFAFGNRRSILDWPYASVSGGNFDISADGQRFIALKPLTNEDESPEVIVVQNWFEELKERVPVD